MTRALILAAGQGTRLRPLTENKPKCLVTLFGESLLKRQVRTLNELGVLDVTVVCGYKAEKVISLGYDCIINANFETTNMVASLFCDLSFFSKNEDLIIGYGDIIYQQDNLAKLLSCDADISLMVDNNWLHYWKLRFDDPLSDAETFLMDDHGYVKELGKKPNLLTQIQGQYTGLIKIRKDKISDFVSFYQKLDRLMFYDGKTFNEMYMTSFLQSLINSDWRIRAVPVANGWLEVDSIFDIKLYESMVKEDTLGQIFKL